MLEKTMEKIQAEVEEKPNPISADNDLNKCPIPRARSSLELLSETATIIESSSSPRDSTPPPMDISPASARITPHTSTNFLSETLKLPEIVNTTAKTKQPLLPRNEILHPSANSTLGTLYQPAFPSSSGLCNTVSNPSCKTSSSFVFHQPVADIDSVQEKMWLRQQLAARDASVATLQTQVHQLQQEIRQLRQLPTGKISQIPVDDMLTLMRTYGSEVSDMAMPPRKSYVQKASVVRQFRRWNPHFLEWFEFVGGRWVPKLGRNGELKRRQQARQQAAAARRGKISKSTGTEQEIK